MNKKCPRPFPDSGKEKKGFYCIMSFVSRMLKALRQGLADMNTVKDCQELATIVRVCYERFTSDNIVTKHFFNL